MTAATLVVHRHREGHPLLPAAQRWLLTPSGRVYWLQDRGEARGWAIFDAAGGPLADGLPALADVRRWVIDGEARR